MQMSAAICMDFSVISRAPISVSISALAADSAEEIKSLVIGPGERLIVECAAAEANFVLIGFEDASTGFTTRTYVADAASSSASG